MKHRLAALLIVVIAVGNRAVVAEGTLSPWDLGGFGMFASIDSPASRAVRVTAQTADGSEFLVNIPDELRTAEEQARVWPANGRMAELVERLEDSTFEEVDGVLVGSDNGTSIEVERIEIFRLVMHGGKLDLELITAFSAEGNDA